MGKQSTLADELATFVNDVMSGIYTLEDVSGRFGAAMSPSSRTYLSVLRELIDSGTVPPPSDR